MITKEELLEFLKTETFALQVARKSFNELISDLMKILNNPEIPEGTKEVIQGVWELLQDLDLRPWDYVEVIEYWGKLLSEKGEKVKPRSFFTEILFRMVDEV